MYRNLFENYWFLVSRLVYKFARGFPSYGFILGWHTFNL